MGTRQEAVQELKRPGIGKQEMVYELEVERENGERIPVEIALDGMVPGKEEIEKLLKAAEEGDIERVGCGRQGACDRQDPAAGNRARWIGNRRLDKSDTGSDG